VVSFPLVGEHAAPQTKRKPAGVRRLESVAVEETPNGIAVLIRGTDGARAIRSLDQRGSGMDTSVVGAVAELCNKGATSLVGVAEADLGGSTVITVVVDVGENRRVSGSAVQSGGRAYAVARATWTALDKVQVSGP
jgi:hypothetical protein